MTTDRLIDAAGTRLTLARAATWTLASVAFLGLLVGPLLGPAGDVARLVGMAAVVVWVMLGVRSARVARLVREAAVLWRMGRTAAAETRAADAMTTFCLLRPVTVGAAEVLARVRSTQGRHPEAAALATFVLGRSERSVLGEEAGKVATRVLLVDSLLAAGLAPAAEAALLPLRQTPDLDLPARLRVLLADMRLAAARGDWPAVLADAEYKVSMLELMGRDDVRRGHALLKQAADVQAEGDWASFLGRRLELLEGPGRDAAATQIGG